MKSLPKKILALTLFAIAGTSLFTVQPAQAFGYTVTVNQVGANVVANGSGVIDLAGLTFSGGFFQNASETANIAQLLMSSGTVDGYTGFSGPTNFGSGGTVFADLFGGDAVGISPIAFNVLLVPTGYISGTALSDSDTWNNATLASLGLTPGTYTWTWGDGGANERFTLEIGSVPDGGTTVCLLGCALLGVVFLRRRLGC
jgi:hypothetical protein